MSFPSSYAELRLPDIRLEHHPASSEAVTEVVVVLLDRPRAKNAFSRAMARSLVAAFEMLSHDPRVRCVVLAGADETNRVFCAGADLDIGFGGGKAEAEDTGSADAPPPPPHTTHRDSGGSVALAIFHCRKPVVAALNGSAVGVGMTMTLPADVRVASGGSAATTTTTGAAPAAPPAKYGFVFARRGLVLESCASFFLPRLLGTSAALFLTSTGAVVPATHRMLAPLFAEIVPPDQVRPTALRIAADIAAHTSTVSTRLMKDMIYYQEADANGHTTPASPETAHLLESSLLFQRFASADLVEGVASFKEKRPPRFQDSLDNSDGSSSIMGYPWWDAKGLEAKLAKLAKL